LRFDELPHLIDGSGGVQIFGAVFKIASPILEFRIRQLGEQWRNDGAGHYSGEEFDEASFVHLKT
jgi:hypothetical protein